MNSSLGLNGRVALVTGSTRGAGLAIAEAVGRAGARVIVSSRNVDDCDGVASDFLNDGLDAASIPCDVGKPAELERLVGESCRHFGPIDCLVCNAAAVPWCSAADAGEDTPGVNVRSILALCGLVLPGMAARGAGSVILVAHGAIAAAAIAGIVGDLASDWGPKGIGVFGLSVRSDSPSALTASVVRLAAGSTVQDAGAMIDV